jgi:surface antigen
MSNIVALVVSCLMVVGKSLILTSTAYAGDLDNPRFFEYRNGGFLNNIVDVSFGWFRTLDDEQKLSYSKALTHAVDYADNGETVRWYKNNASGTVMPTITWPSGNGYCRRVYIQTIAYNVQKTVKANACYDSVRDKWTWFEGK